MRTEKQEGAAVALFGKQSVAAVVFWCVRVSAIKWHRKRKKKLGRPGATVEQVAISGDGEEK